jgi:hypothetical protein
MNGSRPACLYSDPSVFVKTEFDTGEIYIGEKEREGVHASDVWETL